MYGRCTRLIALSEEWAARLQQIVPRERIDILENYCRMPQEPYDAGRNPGQVLFLGELGERKGCFDIPAVWERVRKNHPGASLVMAGDGEMEQIKAAFFRKGLLDTVTFPGWVRGEEKERLLRKSGVFLFPSYHEGMPMAVLEAMGYGLGIVTTTVGGIPQLIDHKRSGFLETPGNVTALAKDVSALIQDEALCRNMGELARRAVEQKYSLEIHLQKLEETYRKACMTK